MAKPNIKAFPMVTVVGSETAIDDKETTALVLHTREAGAVAFAVDQQAIKAIRKHLDKLELAFRPSGGQA